MFIVALTGLKGSGKSEVAKHLVDNCGFVRGKFAGPLKEMLRALLRWQGADADEIEEMVEGSLKEEPSFYLNDATPRHAMQTLGTEWGRELIHPDLWVDIEEDRLERMHGRDVKVVLDDLRFPNEVKFVERHKGVIWRVERPVEISSDDVAAQHISENYHIIPHARLLNDRDLQSLYAMTDAVLARSMSGD